MGKSICLAAILITIIISTATAQALQEEISSARVYEYKKTGDVSLNLYVLYPEKTEKQDLPAIVFYFGGGWVKGSVQHFEPQARQLVNQGIVAILADYRTAQEYQTSPVEAVKDAREAMKFLKQNAHTIGIDPQKIVAAGGSAGGHLALCTTFGVKEKHIPAALVLFNPVAKTTADGYGREKFKNEAQAIKYSPVHQVRSTIPPTIIFHGKADSTVPVENVLELTHKIEQAGGNCQLVLYDDVGHGFFNQGRHQDQYFEKTMNQTREFLKDRGYLKSQFN
ncbi:MAG: alpha/beta hydrolase [Candidatus Cyclobacteriaceae bacterium M3_2C_046]